MRFISPYFRDVKRLKVSEHLLDVKLLLGEDKQISNFQNSEAIDN